MMGISYKTLNLEFSWVHILDESIDFEAFPNYLFIVST